MLALAELEFDYFSLKYKGLELEASKNGNKRTTKKENNAPQKSKIEINKMEKAEKVQAKKEHDSILTKKIDKVLRELRSEEKYPNEDLLKKLFGQIFIIGTREYRVPDISRSIAYDLVKDFNIGGYIVRSTNIKFTKRAQKNPETISYVSESLNTLSTKLNDLPLLLLADNEGGSSSSLAKNKIISELPPPMSLAVSQESDLACFAGLISGFDLAKVGINTNLAPVLDVHFRSDETVIGDRSFGADAQLVASLGTSFFIGQRTSGTLSIAKHFPGHGSTNEGVHTPGLPESSLDGSNLEFSIVPFRKIANEGIDGIMTSHFISKALSQEVISFDPILIKELIRTKNHQEIDGQQIKGLGFDGLIISDDLLVKGLVYIDGNKIKVNYLKRIKEIVTKIFDSGHDMLLLGEIQIKKGKNPRGWLSKEEFKEVYKHLYAHIFNETISSEKNKKIDRLRNSIIRILHAKKRIPHHIYSDKSLLKKERAKYLSNSKLDEIKTSMWKKGFAYKIPLSQGPDFKWEKNKKNVLLVYPTRFRDYKKKSRAALERNFNAWGLSKEIFENLNKLNFNVIREYEIFNPNPKNHYTTVKKRFNKLNKIIKTKNLTSIIFIFDNRGQWDMVLSLTRLLKTNKAFDLNKVILIPNARPSVLARDRGGLARKWRGLREVNFFIPFSGYEERAREAAHFLFNHVPFRKPSNGSWRRNRNLPIEIDFIQQSVINNLSPLKNCPSVNEGS